MVPSATKPPSAKASSAPASSAAPAKTCGGVFRAPQPGPRYYGKQTFTPQQVYADAAYPWKAARIFHGGRYRRVRYKEVRQVLGRHGGQRRLLRLFVLAPTRDRTTKAHYYYRQKAYLLCD